jgi:hypothetical protein
MALAILDIVGLDGSSARFRVDTGTNPYYQLKLGRSVQTRSDLDWVDDVVLQTPLRLNPAGGSMFDTATEILVPVDKLEQSKAYAQLFTFKTRAGRSPAFSSVVRLNRALTLPGPDYTAPESLDMQAAADITDAPFRRPRSVACRTCAEQFSAPAIGDLLTQIVRVAGPIVMQLLGQPQAAAQGGTLPAAGGAAGAPPVPAQANPIAGLVEAILKVIPGLAGPALSGQSSVLSAEQSLNRFGNGAGTVFARPFVFGIDDALIGAAIGQFVQILPQLMNAANQKRIQLQQSHNKLVGDIVSDVNRRLLLEQVLAAQRQAPAGQNADLAKLAELLQQAAPSANGQPSPDAGATAPAVAQSFSTDAGSDATISSRAVAIFVTAPPVQWNGKDQIVYPKGQPVRLQVKLAVAPPSPTAALPKAIVRVVVKDPADQTVFAEKTVKQKDLPPDGVVTVPFTEAELAPIPGGKVVSLLAEIRWLTKARNERKALGSTDVVFVDRYFMLERGAIVGPERELTDQARYRAFWTKVWESPALDAASGGPRKLLWDLDATLKYAVLIAPHQPSNGLMETKVLAAARDADSVADRTEGRMKSGIELSLDEVSKLASLWDGEQAVDAQRLEAFRTDEFAKANAGEIVYRLKLKGRSAERGLVWVVPIFGLVDFRLGSVQTTDDSGQVTATAEEHVRLPVPVAVRVLGLKSGSNGDDSETTESVDDSAPDYHFDGYKVELSDRVALTPAAAVAAPRDEVKASHG